MSHATVRYGYSRGRYVVRIDGAPADQQYSDDGHKWPQQSFGAAEAIARRRADELRHNGVDVDIQPL